MSDVSAARGPAVTHGGRSANHRKAIALSIAAAVGGFLFGFDSSVINGAVGAITDHFSLSSALSGFVVAVALLGSALGAWLAGKVADRWGRTRTMLLGAIMFFASSILTGLSWSVADMILWRIMSGIGIGIASVMAPAYIAEISPASIRGRLGSVQQLAITIGIFVALLSDQLLQNAAGDPANDLWWGMEAWRWMFFVGAVPAAVYGIIALSIPETPRYLASVGKDEDALVVLNETLSAEENPDTHLAQIKKRIADDRENAKHASLRGPRFGLLPVVWVGILLSVFQQFVGINVIFYYSTTLWQAVGFSKDDSFTYSTITSVTNVLVTFIAIALVDKVGRRPLLLIGSVGMALSLGTVALAFTQSTGSGDNVTLPDPWGVIALVAANLFVVFFGATWGPLVWVLLGEMFPNRIRAAALGVAASAQWIANFVISETFPPLLDHFGAAIPYLMYTIFAVLSFFFTLWKVPETRGVELEDMEEVKAPERRTPTRT
ncbi:sugar porter family MFS transporter [Cellulomonas alba]|uniref:Sugar porter family MFS transporter n=1 Tax=Cellulomonas alba TaxID=3053467 RepID=A0ABT7SE69_9CELL|nr:sugar porter family MFS transporter [Cellulomonas alba]MDM7854485.1 sugar porter family MFS transporter [Cellulomonas alba]